MNIYENKIAPLFAKTGKNDKELETIIGLPKGIIYNWRNGRSKNFEAYIPKIATYFHVSADYLMGIEPPVPMVEESQGAEKDPATNGEASSAKKALINLIVDLDEEQCRKLRSIIEEAVNLL